MRTFVPGVDHKLLVVRQAPGVEQLGLPARHQDDRPALGHCPHERALGDLQLKHGAVTLSRLHKPLQHSCTVFPKDILDTSCFHPLLPSALLCSEQPPHLSLAKLSA